MRIRRKLWQRPFTYKPKIVPVFRTLDDMWVNTIKPNTPGPLRIVAKPIANKRIAIKKKKQTDVAPQPMPAFNPLLTPETMLKPKPKGRPRKLPRLKPAPMPIAPTITTTFTSGKNDRKEKLQNTEIRAAAGGCTETQFNTILNKPTNKYVREAIENGIKVVLNLDGGFSLTSSVDAQAAADMTSNTGSVSNYVLNDAIWHGDTASGGSLSVAQTGAFTQLEAMGGSPAGAPKHLFRTCKGMFQFTNQSAAQIYCDIYECVSRHDYNPNEVSTTSVYSPLAYWALGLQNTYIGTSGNVQVPVGGTNTRPTPTSIGCKPWMSEVFNTYWKIAGHYELCLGPGATHLHKFNHTLNHIIPSARYTNSSLLQGITRNLLVVVRGQVGQGFSAAPAATTVATAPAVLNCRFQIQYSSAHYYYSNTVVNYVNQAPAPATVSVSQLDVDYKNPSQ